MTKRNVAGILIAIALFTGGIVFVATHLVRKHKQGKSIEYKNFKNYSADSTITIKQLSSWLPQGLWEIKKDSNTYLLYVDGHGSAITKK